MRRRTQLLAGVYVVGISALAASAFWSPHESFTWSREGLAMLLTLPALVPALPVIYTVGALTWNLPGAGDGAGPMWPVTVVYTAMFAGAAVANVWLLHMTARARRRRRSTATRLT